MIGYGWQVIESSSGREVTPTLYRKARTQDEDGRRPPRFPKEARRDRPAEVERLTGLVRVAFRALPVQVRPRRQVRL